MQIVNIDKIAWEPSENGDFSYLRKQLGQAAGGEKLGASLFTLMPGKKAFPYHFHYANEEAILVLEGNATLRLNNETIVLKKGDYIAFPVGPEHAHQIINTSNAPFVYLCISTMIHPDVFEYPDSNKVGLMAGTAPGGNKNQVKVKAFYKKDSDVAYFDGEA